MGPNNGENQGGGVATLEMPQTTAPAATETGNGLLPTPGASAPEATGAVAQVENIAATAWAGSEAAPTASATGSEATVPTTAGLPEVKPLDSAKPFVSPDMASASATVANRDAQQEAFMAQQSKEKTGWGNKILGFVGLRGGVKTETVGQSANAMPDHLKDGVTPPVPNVTPEAAAAVNQDSTKLSSADLGPAPDFPAAATQEGLSPMGTEAPAASTAEPSSPPTSSETSGTSPDNTGLDATNAVKEADSIVKNATGTGAALDEIDKTATDTMNSAPSETKPDDGTPAGTTGSSSEPFPSYGVQTEAAASSGSVDATADATQDAAPGTAPAPDSPSAWPSAPASEPTTSGPSAVAEPPAAPDVPEYKPTTDMAPAGEVAAPTTPASWSIDASAAHPDAPVVGGVSPAPEAPAPTPSDPNALKLESTPTPLAGAPTETPPPFGTGMPPSMGETAPVTAPSEADVPSPTVPEAPVEPALGSASTTAAPEPPPMDILGQANQVAAAETSGGALPTSGVTAPAMESGVSMGGNVLEQAAAVADTSGASSLGQAETTTAEPVAAAVSPTTETTTQTDPLAASPATATS